MEEVATLLKQLDYNGVEWRVHSIPREHKSMAGSPLSHCSTVDIESITKKAREVRALTEDHGLEVLALGTYLSYRLTEDIERCMEAAAIMGARSIRVSPPAYDGSQNYNDLYEEAVEGFAKVEDLAREFQVRATVELHPRGICCSASLGYRLVSNFDPDYVGVILDPGNMMMEGFENWQMGLELLGPYLSHVHVKNSAWFAEDLSDGRRQWHAAVVPLREGSVSWSRVIEALDAVGYNGWLCLEDLSEGDTRTKLADGIAYLRSLEVRVGAA